MAGNKALILGPGCEQRSHGIYAEQEAEQDVTAFHADVCQVGICPNPLTCDKNTRHIEINVNRMLTAEFC